MGEDSIQQLSLAKTTKQSLLSLLFNLGGILAGAMVAASLGIFSREPWMIALYPGVLSIRGVIGGLFSGHLSTGLHLGTIQTSLFGERTKRFCALWASIVVLTFESSIFLGSLAMLFGVALLGLSVSSALPIFGTLIATMGMSIVAISPLTIAIAFSSFKRGLDPDIIVYPIESTMADILVTLCYTTVLNVLFLKHGGWIVVLTVCIVFMVIVLIISYKNRKEADFTRTIRESTYMLFLVALTVNITGWVLSRISEVVGHKPEIYAIYPALIDTIGDVGAIVGSTATTKLALGTLRPSLRSIKHHRNQIAGVWLASIVMYALYAFISSLYKVPISLSETLRFIGVLLGTNILAVSFMICISFSVAIITFHRGLDPDNFVIPVESSLADTVTTVSLLAMLSFLGGV